jgi:hypothetical protein
MEPLEIIEALRTGTIEWPQARDALVAHSWTGPERTPGYAGIIERWHDVPDEGEFEIVLHAIDVIGKDRLRELYAAFAAKIQAEAAARNSEAKPEAEEGGEQ